MKTLYESNADTNALNDADKAKLDALDSSAYEETYKNFGIGTSAKFITIADYNDLDQYATGMYAVFHPDVSTVANTPSFKATTNVNAIVEVIKEGDRFSIRVTESKRSDSRHYRNKVGSSAWSG